MSKTKDELQVELDELQTALSECKYIEPTMTRLKRSVAKKQAEIDNWKAPIVMLKDDEPVNDVVMHNIEDENKSE